MDVMIAAAVRPESELAERLRSHLGVEPKELPVTAAEFPPTEHANLQLALEDVLAGAELIGHNAPNMPYQPVGLAEILAGQAVTGQIKLGPVRYENVEVGDGRVIQCVGGGLYLTERDGAPMVLVVSRGERPF